MQDHGVCIGLYPPETFNVTLLRIFFFNLFGICFAVLSAEPFSVPARKESHQSKRGGC